MEQNERLTSRMEKEKKMIKKETWHEQAFIVLCIYTIVYVWIWRIWKYMLTNLYRVFYVMWNTWSRCSLVSLALHLFLFLFSLLFLFYFKATYQKNGMTLFEGSFFFFLTYKATSVHAQVPGI